MIATIDDLSDDLKGLVEWAKMVKDAEVKNASAGENDDITPHIGFRRDGKVVAGSWARHVNRDEGLELARLGVTIFGADEIDALFDAHAADQKFHEKYGRLPDPHELQELCHTEGACEIGLITDCIIVCRAEKVEEHRAHLVMVTLPYHVDQRDEILDPKTARAITGDDRDHILREGNTYTRVTRSVHWQDDQITVWDDTEDDAVTHGVVPDTLRQLFVQDSLMEMMGELGTSAAEFGLNEAEARLHADIAGTRILAQLGFGVILAVFSEEDKAIVDASMARYPNIAAFDQEGNQLAHDPKAALDPMILAGDLLVEMNRRQLQEALEERHEAELAEAATRRAARVNGAASAEDIERMRRSVPGGTLAGSWLSPNGP